MVVIRTFDQLKKRSQYLTEQEIASALESVTKSPDAKLCYLCRLETAPRLQRDYSGFDVLLNGDISALRLQVADSKYEIFETRRDLGNDVFTVVQSDEIVGWRWLSRDLRIFPQDLFTGCLPADTAYAYDAFIQRRYRGYGLLAFLTSRMFEETGNGIGLSSYSDFENLTALRAKEKYGEVKRYLVLVEPDSAEMLKIYD